MLDHDKLAGHAIKDIAEAEVLHRQALLLHMNNGQISLTKIQENLKQIEQEKALLKAAKETNKGEIKEFIELAHKKLEQRKENLSKAMKSTSLLYGTFC